MQVLWTAPVDGHYQVAFDTTGTRVVSVGADCRVYNVADGSLVRTITPPIGYGVGFYDPRAAEVVFYNAEMRLRFYSVLTGGFLGAIATGFPVGWAGIAFTPDSVILYEAAWPYATRGRYLRSNGSQQWLRTNRANSWGVLITDGAGASAIQGSDSSLRLFATSNGMITKTFLPVPGEEVKGYAVNSGGSLLYGASEFGVCVWRTRDQGLPVAYWSLSPSLPTGQFTGDSGFALAPDDSVVAATFTGGGGPSDYVTFYRASDGSPIKDLMFPAVLSSQSSVQPLALSPDKTRIAAIRSHGGSEVLAVAATNLPSGALQPSGSVVLEDFAGNIAGVPLALELCDPSNGSVLERHDFTATTAGTFSFQTGLTGSVIARLKAPNWLSQSRLVALQNGSASGLDFRLRNGDVDGDNSVSIADFIRLRSSLGASYGSVWWDDGADLNGDRSVSVADFLVLRRNFGQSGN